MHTLTLSAVVQIPWRDYFDPNASIPDNARNLGEAARAAACSLYQRYPRWLTGDYSGLDVPSPQRFLWDFICRDEPPPVLPPGSPPPFVGGQCCDVVYRVIVQVNVDGNATTVALDRLGKIEGIKFRTVGTSDADYQRAAYLISSEAQTCRPVIEDLLGSVDADGGGVLEATVINIVRLDGQPDECGDRPPEFPDLLPEPEDLNFPINVNIDGFDISVPVSIPFTVYPPIVNFAPEFSVNIGGMRVTFDLGGVNFTFNSPGNPPRIPDGNDPRPPSSQPPPVRPPSGSPGGACPDVDLTPVIARLIPIQSDVAVTRENVELLLDCDRCRRPEIGSPQLGVQKLPPASSGIVPLPDRTAWVGIDILEMPELPRTQIGLDAPNVYYAGWFSMGSGDNNGERGAIRYRSNAYPVEEGITNFTYTLYPGYKGEVTVWFVTEEE